MSEFNIILTIIAIVMCTVLFLGEWEQTDEYGKKLNPKEISNKTQKKIKRSKK